MATIKIKKIEAPIGGGGEEEIFDRVSKGRGPIEESVDVRDIISGLVGKGFTNLTDPDAQKNVARLHTLLGKQKANEIVQKIMIHNQDARYKSQPTEQRISSFYDLQKEDPVIGKARALGYGVLPGFRTSPNVLLQSLQGSPISFPEVESPGLTRKILVKTQ